MDEPSLQGVDLKIARAQAHLADLKETINRALSPDRHSFRVEFDSKTAKHLLWVNPLPIADPEWSIVIGEILFNLRSALDHLAHQLIFLDGKTPTNNTQFPIRESPLYVKGKLIGIDIEPPIKSTEILAALNEFQPYQGVDGEVIPPDESPLWWLKKLNNIDKHRMLLIVVCILNISEMWWDSPDTPAPVVRVETCSFKEGSPIACFDFNGLQPPPKFNPNPSLSIAINEAETPIIRREPFSDILSGLCRHIEVDIVGCFRAMFEEREASMSV